MRSLILHEGSQRQGSSRSPLLSKSVAIFIYNYSTSGVAYSGGRYHALLVAYALSGSGVRVTVVTDSPLAWIADMEQHRHREVRYVYADNFDADQVTELFDYVLVAPTGAFYPEFYGCAQRVAERSGATVVLINYESANWFNSLAPTPNYPEVWDYWRRVVISGGLVLSSTSESDRHARDYYKADTGELQFDYCYPPINSATADVIGLSENDGSIVYFARPHHDRKGGADVLALPPDVFAGRTLRVIFGGEVVPEYCNALESRLNLVDGATLTVHPRISDHEKYALLARASALLFPSRLEGFGYPPVEAAYAGTETACYDLPVLVETVGDVAHMAPVGDIEALASARRAALDQPNRSRRLRASVAHKVGMAQVAKCLLTVLAADGVATPASQDGSTVLAIVIWVKGMLARCMLRFGDAVVQAESIVRTATIGGWTRTEVAMRLSKEAIGSRLSLTGYDSAGCQVHPSYGVCVHGVSSA